MIDCREVGALRGAFLGLELEAVREAEVRGHLRTCPACAAELAAVEPAAALALRLAAVEVPDDPAFVAAVLGGIHQHRVEGRLFHRRRGALAAAAALLVAVLGGWALVRGRGPAQPAELQARGRAAAASVEPAFVEVEGAGVRLYQFDDQQHETRVALIVDPQLEL